MDEEGAARGVKLDRQSLDAFGLSRVLDEIDHRLVVDLDAARAHFELQSIALVCVRVRVLCVRTRQRREGSAARSEGLTCKDLICSYKASMLLITIPSDASPLPCLMMLSGFPEIVNVFPDPVGPYANTVAENPSQT